MKSVQESLWSEANLPFRLVSENALNAAATKPAPLANAELFPVGDVRSMPPTKLDRANASPKSDYVWSDCHCPQCGGPSNGFTDAAGFFPLKCHACTSIALRPLRQF